jgi:hypothetical protein
LVALRSSFLGSKLRDASYEAIENIVAIPEMEMCTLFSFLPLPEDHALVDTHLL